MTFDPNIPNAGQSPGLFPPQNNQNFARIKTIINADHVFNDTAQSTDGFHRQATMIVRAQPGGLPVGSNAILYAWLDGAGQTQLRFYNGATDYQLTPLVAGPTKVTGSVALAGNATSGTIYTIPNNSFGTIFVNYISPAGNFYRYYIFYKSGNTFVDAKLIEGSSNTSRPDISISGSNIRVVNGNSSARTVAYYIIVESI
jgi:hypothetical protein